MNNKPKPRGSLEDIYQNTEERRTNIDLFLREFVKSGSHFPPALARGSLYNYEAGDNPEFFTQHLEGAEKAEHFDFDHLDHDDFPHQDQHPAGHHRSSLPAYTFLVAVEPLDKRLA